MAAIADGATRYAGSRVQRVEDARLLTGRGTYVDDIALPAAASSSCGPPTSFFTGVWSTVLGPDELLTGISIPTWTGRCGFAVQEFARRHGDFAVAGAAVGVQLDDADVVRRCAIGLIGMSSAPVRAASAEGLATGAAARDVPADELGRVAAADAVDVPSDLQGTPAYRRQVCAAMVARAWRSAIEEALGG